MRLGMLLKWGVWLIGGWALSQAVLVFVNVLLLTQAIRLNVIESGNQTQIWIIFILSVVFGLAFISCTYGLWRRYNWGRLMFLWTNLVWSGFNIIALFVPTFIFASGGRHDAQELATSTFLFALTLIIPLLYLNLPRVKALFYNNL